jgi:hypothetical protein
MLLDQTPEESPRLSSEPAGVKGFAPAERCANALRIGRNSKGAWIVKDRLGLRAGIFRSYGCALQFAKEEAAAHGLIIVAAQGPLELCSD